MGEQASPGDALGAIPGTTIRFFLSSTFRDFQIERDVLQERVFPQLRRRCAAQGYRLQPIDLRWGVSEAAGTNRQTLRICFDELERCRALSPDCFLLIQLGERYGSCLLPPQVPAAVVARLLPHLVPEKQERFADAYQLDENAVPAEYVLLRADGPHDTADEQLRLALVLASHAAGVGEAERLLFEGSATHRELQLGLLGEGAPPDDGPAAPGVLCAVRRFVGDRVGPAFATYAAEEAERAERVRQVTAAVLARVPAEQVLRYAVAWEGERGPVFDRNTLAAAYLGLLGPQLEAVMAARTAARTAAIEHGRDAAALANAAFATERLAYFVGRAAPLAAIAKSLAAPASGPLVVAGPGGSGKSTLLARAAEQARSAHPAALVLTRYIGVTPGAERLRSLLDGLRAELAAAYGHALEPMHEDAQRSQAFRAALDWATAEQPLIVVVDALDQLGPPPVPLDWLPDVLPPHVHLVVSLLDEADRPELAALQRRHAPPQVLHLERMDAAEGDALLARWLAEAGRTLQPPQRAAVLAAFAEEGRPLQLRLAFEEARRWRSFDKRDEPDRQVPLAPTIDALVTGRFARLEADAEHGPVLTGRALGLLRAATQGLAEDELLDVLAQDADVRSDLHRLSPSSPPIAAATADGVLLPLPVALWARLYSDLAPYLTEREADGTRLLTFYHRQLVEVAAARYLNGEEGVARHQQLARYFEQQPLVEGSQPNLRKLAEQPTQEAAGGLTDDLHDTLTDVSFLEQQLGYQGVAEVLDDLALAPPDDEAVWQLAAVVRAGAVVLEVKPDELRNQIQGRVGAIPALHHLPPLPEPALVLQSVSLPPPDPGLLRTFSGHTSGAEGCAFSPDGQTALSASHDQTLRLWDVATGEALRTFSGHTSWVTGCAFSPDGRTALSVSWDHTLRLWDVASGEERAQWLHDAPLQCCAWSPVGAQVVAGDSNGGVHFVDIVGLRMLLSPQQMPHADAVSAVPAPQNGIANPAEKPRPWWPFGRH